MHPGAIFEFSEMALEWKKCFVRLLREFGRHWKNQAWQNQGDNQ
jgi:hypothetical protein